MKRSILVSAVALLLMSGCALLPEVPGEAIVTRMPNKTLDAFRLEGRISVRRGEENFSAGIDWRHGGGSDLLFVTGPLGQGLARLTADASGAHLETSDGQRFEAAGLDELSERVFGARLPVSRMAAWVLGRKNGAEAAGWTVEYLRYESEAPDALPILLRARGNGMEVRLVVDAWGASP